MNTRKSKYSSFGMECSLSRWDAYTDLTLDENVEYRPYLGLDIDKLKNEEYPLPKSDVIFKVKPILPEIFSDYYKLFLRSIRDAIFLEDDEYYQQDHKLDSYEIQYFAGESRKHNSIHIKFYDSMKFFYLTVSRSGGYSMRPGWRKNGTAINKLKFLQYFNLTLQFLSDPGSYNVFLNDYILNFKKLINGSDNLNGFIVTPEQTLSEITKQLDARKLFIEDRLIRSDSDDQLTRSQLRGELDGILYAIKTIKGII